MCSLQRNYDVIRNWERFETGPLTVLGNIFAQYFIQLWHEISLIYNQLTI